MKIKKQPHDPLENNDVQSGIVWTVVPALSYLASVESFQTK